MVWPAVCLGDIINVKHIFAFKGEYFVEYETKDILVTPGNFAIGGGFQLNKAKFYDGPVPPEYILSPGDVVVTMTDLSKQADTLGYSALIPDRSTRFLHNQRVGKVTLKDQNADLNFAAWLMRTQSYRNQIVGSATGSTVKHTSPGRILSYKFRLPPVNEQRNIAAVLSALDNKIELNRRMNETLEASARALFRDWFIDFGPTRAETEGRPAYLAPDLWSLFPNYFDDDGRPGGWTESSVGQEFDLTMGQSPPGDTYNDEGIGLPFFQGRSDFGFRYPSRRKFCSAPARIASQDDTLISVRAPVGDLNMAWERCCIGRGVAAARHLSGLRGYSYYLLHSIQRKLEEFEDTGTVFGAINKVQFERLQVTAPPRRLIEAFEDRVLPIDDRIRSNTIESSTLAATRDMLLPKLMSGVIRLSDSEKAVAAIC